VGRGVDFAFGGSKAQKKPFTAKEGKLFEKKEAFSEGIKGEDRPLETFLIPNGLAKKGD